jgi:hypothetical protein
MNDLILLNFAIFLSIAGVYYGLVLSSAYVNIRRK